MGDKVGNLPKIISKEQALKEILYMSTDKRSHIMLQDALDWERLKMKVIARFARAGLKIKGEVK